MIIGSKDMKISIFRDEIQDGHHKNSMGYFFGWDHQKLFFLHILEFKKVGVVKSSGGCTGSPPGPVFSNELRIFLSQFS